MLGRIPLWLVCLCLCLGIGSIVWASDSSPRVKQPEYAEKLNIPGLKDLGKIDGHLYRGAQPSGKGLKQLREKLDVDTIVDLRAEFKFILLKRERKHAKQLGMQVVSIPGNGWSPPNDKEIAEFFALIQQRPQRRVFVHCWLGGDRVGDFIAAYRIAFDGWTADQAIREMHMFHFKSHWHPAMEKFVRKFPERLATSPALAPYRHAQIAETAPH
jgi:protein tyrosine/serine phosphatase